MTKGVLSSVNSREVKLLVSLPKLVSGNSLQNNIQDFRIPEWDNSIHKGLRRRNFRASECIWYELQNETWRGWRHWADLSIVPRIHAFSSKPTIQNFCSNPGGTFMGAVIELKIVKILDKYGLEIAIPSPDERERTSYVVISRGKSRFVDEIHIPKAGLRSGAEWFSELQKSGGGESCVAQSNTRIQETGAIHVSSYTSNKETCANTLSILPTQASLHTKRTIRTNERKWKVIRANSSYGGALSIQVSKMVTRHHDQDERQSDASMHWDMIRAVLLKAFAKHGARDFSDQQGLRLIHEGSSETRFEYCQDFQPSLAYFRAIQGHSGGTVDPELMGYVLIPYNWKEYFYHRCCSFSIQSLLQNGLIPRGKKATKDCRLSSSHHWTLLVEILKKNPMIITQFLKRCTITVIGNEIRTPFVG